MTQYGNWFYTYATLVFSWPISLLVGSLVPFLSSWASLAHLLSLGILGRFLIFHTHGLLLTLLSFPGSIILFLILGAHGLPINPLLSYFITSGLLWPILTLLLHIMPMSLLSLSGGSFRPVCFPQGPLIYFIGLRTIVPTIQLNSFSNHPLILLCLYCWVSFCYWASKIGINTKDDRHY